MKENLAGTRFRLKLKWVAVEASRLRPRRTLLQYADAIAIDFHDHNPAQRTMKVRQAVIAEPFKVEVRDIDLPDPAPNQILVECEFSAISAGTELAVYTGSHQWLKDPKMMDWKNRSRLMRLPSGGVGSPGRRSCFRPARVVPRHLFRSASRPEFHLRVARRTREFGQFDKLPKALVSRSLTQKENSQWRDVHTGGTCG